MPIFDTEKEFEDELFLFMTKNLVNPINGNRIFSVIRQPNLGYSGIPDLITYEQDQKGLRFVNVIELKNTAFKAAHISQVTHYMSAIKAAIDFGNCFSVCKENAGDRFPGVSMNIANGAKLIGTIVTSELIEIDAFDDKIDGLLFLSDVSVYAVMIENLRLRFECIADGFPCIGNSQSLQGIFKKLIAE